MNRKKTANGAKYVRHRSTTRVELVHFMRIGRYKDDQAPLHDISDILEDGSLKPEVLDGIYQRYQEEYRHTISAKTTLPRRFWRHLKAFVRHESYEVDPHSLPPVKAVVVRLENAEGTDNDYVNQAYRAACYDATERAEKASERWNKAKEIANIALPIPLGIAAFLTGYLAGAEGAGWAAVTEFVPYAALPLAVWARGKEHRRRAELEEMAISGRPQECVEDARASMKMYNAIKDGASFWFPVAFDSVMTGLSYSGAIPTPAGYMTGIVAAPYVAHGGGFFSMMKEHGKDERAAILCKMMETKVIVADSRTPTDELIRSYL